MPPEGTQLWSQSSIQEENAFTVSPRQNHETEVWRSHSKQSRRGSESPRTSVPLRNLRHSFIHSFISRHIRTANSVPGPGLAPRIQSLAWPSWSPHSSRAEGECDTVGGTRPLELPGQDVKPSLFSLGCVTRSKLLNLSEP